ncbi:MAG: hypothetical protein C4297_10615 [Gemmataceae bacterium]
MHKYSLSYAIAFLKSTCAVVSILASAQAGLPVDSIKASWLPDDLVPGMKGYGLTTFRGARADRFDVEVIGVLKNVSPGRDLVLVKLAGSDLERTGVIAGMSGSPVYIEGKLVGAIAYAWAFGKEPIAGVTPFRQMAEAADTVASTSKAGASFPKGLSLPREGGSDVSGGSAGVTTASGWLVPLRTPVAASGFTARSLHMLNDAFKGYGLLPVQGGTLTGPLSDAERLITPTPGAPLAIGMVVGDFDLSGMGTITHIEGKRVYGWGHPFLGLGQCEYPMLSGYVHGVLPRYSLSFKLGSPARPIGTITQDTTAGVAGWLDKPADLLPLHMTVALSTQDRTRHYHVGIVRHRNLTPQLVLTCLSNALDLEGELPEDITLELKLRLQIAGEPDLVWTDLFAGSGYGGSRAAANLYSQVAALLQTLTVHAFEPVIIKSMDCTTRVQEGRRSAEVVGARADADEIAPGSPLFITVYLRPYRGEIVRRRMVLYLPEDLPDGNYQVAIVDGVTHARQTIGENPALRYPTDRKALLDGVRLITNSRRTDLVARLSLPGNSLVIHGVHYSGLPGSIAEALAGNRRAGAQTVPLTLTARLPTGFVIQGSETIKFTVKRR